MRPSGRPLCHRWTGEVRFTCEVSPVRRTDLAEGRSPPGCVSLASSLIDAAQCVAMRLPLSALVAVALLLTPTATSALCQVAMVDNASYCEVEREGTCCVVEHTHQDMFCLEVWCHDFDACRWEPKLKLCG